MIRTTIWFIYFWLYLLFALPELLRVQYLGWRGRLDEQEKVLFSRVGKWARSLVRLAGGEINVTGAENIPADGPVIFIANHQGNFDIPILLGFIAKPKAFLAKVEIKNLPLISTWMQAMKCVFIKRDSLKHSREAFRQNIQVLQEGRSLVVFPEGTRSKSSRLGEFKTSGFKLAQETKVPIVPITLDGTYNLMERQGWIMRPATVRVKIDPPVHPESNQDPRALTAQIRQIIADNLKEMSKLR